MASAVPSLLETEEVPTFSFPKGSRDTGYLNTGKIKGGDHLLHFSVEAKADIACPSEEAASQHKAVKPRLSPGHFYPSEVWVISASDLVTPLEAVQENGKA